MGEGHNCRVEEIKNNIEKKSIKTFSDITKVEDIQMEIYEDIVLGKRDKETEKENIKNTCKAILEKYPKIDKKELKGYVAKKVEEIYPEHNFSDIEQYKDKPNWRGVERVKMIWHGDTADPELYADGYVANYWDIEDGLYEMAAHEGLDFEDDKVFNEFCQENREAILRDIKELGKSTKHDFSTLTKRLEKLL